ncbi:hypothetical protein TSUD_354070 [Trifolium subterraneum]|uniref:Uncharacterized protein n=1 Tax=Trifolium subterraneum TaxID=3900 RepID=A0A2Z6MRF2_TRISU|nr:hypothetical protein TSUD_354070 [Trifolium subterraneum]
MKPTNFQGLHMLPRGFTIQVLPLLVNFLCLSMPAVSQMLVQVGVLFSRIKEAMSFVMVIHVSGELNREAHDLASLARSVGSRTWMGSAPPNLFSSHGCSNYVGHVQAIPV